MDLIQLHLNIMITVLCIQWGMYLIGLMDVIFKGKTHSLSLNIDTLAQGDTAATVALISFGAVMYTIHTNIV